LKFKIKIHVLHVEIGSRLDPTVLHAGLGRRQAEGNTLQVRGQFTVGRANKTGCTNSGH
jgi:hypothetical protein